MGVGAGSEPVERERRSEPLDAALTHLAHDVAEELGDANRRGAVAAFVLAGGRNAEGLAQVLLVDAAPAFAVVDPVVARDDHRSGIGERDDA